MAIPYQTPGGVTGSAKHVQTRYLSGGVSPHPLQRTGAVPFTSHIPQPAPGAHSGIGAQMQAAPNHITPPPVQPVLRRGGMVA